MLLLSALEDNFKKIGTCLSRNILLTVECMMRCCSCNTSNISRELTKLNKKSFKTNDIWLYRLINNNKFQIDDKFWRCYVNSMFDILIEQGEIKKKGDKILINIDFTSDTDDFLILFASISLGRFTIPIYFSMRNYPRRKNQMNQKKMELAFLRELRHLLSDKHQYIIVADRGFGNGRFISQCIDNGFDVMIRIEPNMKIKTAGMVGIAEEILVNDGRYLCYIRSWRKYYTIIRHSKDDKTWYIVTNLSDNNILEAHEIYKKRFRIEKLFQNLKSSGFDMENSKIKKYDRFKRILFLSCFAYSITILIGKFIDEKLPNFKKNSPIFTNLLIASSSLGYMQSHIIQKKPIISSISSLKI